MADLNPIGVTGITPVTAFKSAAFYDPNNNTLNTPCEGPKMVQVNIDVSDIDGTPQGTSWRYDIDFNSVSQTGQFTALQGVYVDMIDFIGAFSAVVDCDFYIVVNGTGQRIQISRPTIYAPVGPSYVDTFSGMWIPLTPTSPPKISVFAVAGTTGVVGLLRLTFYNHNIQPLQLIGKSPT
jgi:hypothetical protein